VETFIDNMAYAFGIVLVDNYTPGEKHAPLADAAALTKMLLDNISGGHSISTKNSDKAASDSTKGASSVNGWYGVTCHDDADGFWKKVGKIALGTLGGAFGTVLSATQWVNWSSTDAPGSTSISLSNLARSFLTYYASSLGGFATGYDVNPHSKDSVYVTDDLNYLYTVTEQDSYANQTDMLTADFYNMLFNNICVHGWTESNNVDDKNYLSHALKNGQLFVSALNTDGYFYQDHYTKNGRVIEVKDDDAIARAELEYSKKKTKLNYKEQMLEVKMKNIDMELSSLTTEYDAVKNLIGKNVEKTFALFQ
jgi:hypothetical protein